MSTFDFEIEMKVRSTLRVTGLGSEESAREIVMLALSGRPAGAAIQEMTERSARHAPRLLATTKVGDPVATIVAVHRVPDA